MTESQMQRLEAIEQQAEAVTLQADALRRQVAALRLEMTAEREGPVEPDQNLPDGAGLRERFAGETFINGDDGHGTGTGLRSGTGRTGRAAQGAGGRGQRRGREGSTSQA